MNDLTPGLPTCPECYANIGIEGVEVRQTEIVCRTYQTRMIAPCGQFYEKRDESEGTIGDRTASCVACGKEIDSAIVNGRYVPIFQVLGL